MCLSSILAPISSRMKGMMCGFTAKKSTSLWRTVSLLWGVRFTPILCRSARTLSLPQGPSAHKAESPVKREALRLLGEMLTALYSGMCPL